MKLSVLILRRMGFSEDHSLGPVRRFLFANEVQVNGQKADIWTEIESSDTVTVNGCKVVIDCFFSRPIAIK